MEAGEWRYSKRIYDMNKNTEGECETFKKPKFLSSLVISKHCSGKLAAMRSTFWKVMIYEGPYPLPIFFLWHKVNPMVEKNIFSVSNST